MIQVETLGAGGGSIGWIDSMGLLQVGPQSAGARPGPACYGEGGALPTVTDANLVLGYLNPKGLLGGRLPLDLDKARKAIKMIADPLGISVERAAYGMFTIVNSNMVNGIRRVSVERGYDPRDFVLVGAGGATAAHITFLAGEMGIDTVILPKLASGLCAFGQIISDVKYNYMATSPLRLEGSAYASINRLFEQIEEQGVKHLVADGFAKSAIRIERSLDMRYVGQVHECTVEIGNFGNDARALEKVKNAFHKRHEELYTYSEPHNAVEVVNIESTLYGHVDKPQPPRVKKGAPAAKAVVGRRKAIFAADGKLVNTPVYDGSKLGAGATIKGPSIIEEVTTTIVIEPKWSARLDAQRFVRDHPEIRARAATPAPDASKNDVLPHLSDCARSEILRTFRCNLGTRATGGSLFSSFLGSLQMRYATLLAGAAIAASVAVVGGPAKADAKWWPAKYYNLDSGSPKVEEYVPLKRLRSPGTSAFCFRI